MKTYIILTSGFEIYCGKTNNIERRLKEHQKGIKGKWFEKEKRQKFLDVIVIEGDWEKEIKRAGVNNVFHIIRKSERLDKWEDAPTRGAS